MAALWPCRLHMKKVPGASRVPPPHTSWDPRAGLFSEPPLLPPDPGPGRRPHRESCSRNRREQSSRLPPSRMSPLGLGPLSPAHLALISAPEDLEPARKERHLPTDSPHQRRPGAGLCHQVRRPGASLCHQVLSAALLWGQLLEMQRRPVRKRAALCGRGDDPTRHLTGQRGQISALGQQPGSPRFSPLTRPRGPAAEDRGRPVNSFTGCPSVLPALLTASITSVE